jgi:hypothetical protein
MEKISKKSYSRKEYIFPSGRIELIQGYEPFAINDLLFKENIQENDIVTGCKNIPIIWYKDDADKLHKHYVDIFIPSKNLCIEVKSSWTIKKENVFQKQSAAKDLGYNYEIWVYNNKGERLQCYK